MMADESAAGLSVRRRSLQQLIRPIAAIPAANAESVGCAVQPSRNFSAKKKVTVRAAPAGIVTIQDAKIRATTPRLIAEIPVGCEFPLRSTIIQEIGDLRSEFRTVRCPARLVRSAIVLKPSTITSFHQALLRRKSWPSTAVLTPVIEARPGCFFRAYQGQPLVAGFLPMRVADSEVPLGG